MNSVNTPISETSLYSDAISWLDSTLPGGWKVEPPLQVPGGDPSDLTIRLTAPNGVGTPIIVEEKASLSPRVAAALLSPIAKRMRSISGQVPVLVIAPWISERARTLLEEQQINYIDLTGNALLRLDNPSLFIRTAGADRNPSPRQQAKAQLRGPKAGRLVRFLLDVRPPYTASELSEATGLTPGYVSRLLNVLYDEALIERASRGAVESVDIASLVRRWADYYDVFESNQAAGFIAPQGAEEVLEQVKGWEQPPQSPLVVSGSFAAAAMSAPVAPPALLIAYSERPRTLAEQLGLLPTDAAPDVILLKPFDPVVTSRSMWAGAFDYAAPAQVAVDCLTGNGRMPAEGEALLEWMVGHEPAWRAAHLSLQS